MVLFAGVFVSLVILAVVLLTTDVNITQTRRIEAQVARERARVRTKTLKGWSVERIASRYPDVAVEQITLVRREVARSIAAEREIRLLKSLWSLSPSEPR